LGGSALEAALKSFSEIPSELVHDEWIRGITEDASQFESIFEQEWEAQAKKRLRVQQEVKPMNQLNVGDLVLVTKPFYEKGEGLILPQADGPYLIAKKHGEHSVFLEDVLAGTPAFGGQRVSADRCKKFAFPLEWAHIDLTEDRGDGIGFRDGDMVALRWHNRVHVSRVDRVFTGNTQVEVTVYEIAQGDRFGPWSRRPWKVKTTEATGAPVKEVVEAHDIIIRVDLQQGALSQHSLEKLAAAGLDLSGVPRLEATLPPPVH
jgi:hypothetical protein